LVDLGFRKKGYQKRQRTTIVATKEKMEGRHSRDSLVLSLGKDPKGTLRNIGLGRLLRGGGKGGERSMPLGIDAK